jgi:arginyl-tRNA synthetase
MDPALTLGEHVRRAIVAAYGEQHAGVDPQVARSDRADLQSNVALGLARRVGEQPRRIAERIAEALRATDLVERVEVAGAGFLNITLADRWLGEASTRVAADERLGVPRTEAPDRVVIDYSSPNVAKEMHVGHLRSTNIGDALARVLAWRGHTVIRQNHLGDWGTPFGMLIEHFIDVGQEQAEHALAVGELTTFYRAARAKFESDPAFAARSRHRVVQLQAGDPQSRAWWRGLLAQSLGYVERLYADLGVTLTPEDVCPESFHNERLGPLADERRSAMERCACSSPASRTSKAARCR